MSSWAIAVVAALAFGFVAFEVWGRQPSPFRLTSSRVLRDSLELLRARGVRGALLEIEFTENKHRVVVRKELSELREIKFVVWVTTKATGAGAGSHPSLFDERTEHDPESSSDANSFRCLVGNDIAEVERVVRSYSEVVGAHLHPDAVATFRGAILAYDLPGATGSATNLRRSD